MLFSYDYTQIMLLVLIVRKAIIMTQIMAWVPVRAVALENLEAVLVLQKVVSVKIVLLLNTIITQEGQAA